LRKDGSLVHISVTVSPIKDSTGNIVGASKVARDITERKREEEALRDAQALYHSLLSREAPFSERGLKQSYAETNHQNRRDRSGMPWPNVLQLGPCSENVEWHDDI
jgi:hypothetical protein